VRGLLPRGAAPARELILENRVRSGRALTSPGAVRDYLRLAIGDREHEVFVVVHLDAEHRVLAFEELFRGTLTQTSVYPREVVKAALKHNAAAVIFAQNPLSAINHLSARRNAATRLGLYPQSYPRMAASA
jgi:DNA repair protein RadC